MRAKWLILLIPCVSLASGLDVEVEQSQGDQVVHDSSTALGFAHSLGDVDINQCMGSTAWGTILVSKQKLVLNKWCAGEVYDAKGLYRMGAIMRCSIDAVNVHFADNAACLAANEVSVPVVIEHENADRDDEDYRALQARLSDLEAKTAQAKAEARNARRSAQAMPPKVQEEIDAYELRRVKAKAALAGEK